MIKYLGIISIILFSVSIGFCQKQKTTNSKFKKLSIIENTDEFEFVEYKDSTVFKYKSFTVSKTYNEELGETIIINNNKELFTIDEYPAYFQGLVDNFLILDLGSSTTRELKIYDLDQKKVIFESIYYNNLIVKNKKLYFNTDLNISNRNNQPDCPEMQSIIEKHIFAFNTLKLIKSGTYDCAYLE